MIKQAGIMLSNKKYKNTFDFELKLYGRTNITLQSRISFVLLNNKYNRHAIYTYVEEYVSDKISLR